MHELRWLLVCALPAIVAGALAFPVGLLGGLWLGPRVPAPVHARAVTGLLLALGVGSIVAGLAA
jgi:hypothetical protein